MIRGREKASSRPSLIVGRAAEVGYLEQCLEVALRGERQVVFVSGEPGIGKTTIVESFLERLSDWTDLQIGHGQCIEQYGAGEAYLPLLEIGTRICQAPGSEHVIALLRQYAPSWLVQLPGVLAEAEWEQLSRRVQGTTRERMLREAAEVVVQFTRNQGYVLVLEDLHWSDVSTLEWLSYIAQRREPAKLLLIGTYRPTDVLVSSHPLRGVVQDLIARGRCEELRVAPLSEQAVSEYIQARFTGALVSSTLPGFLHRRTGGNPLFMVAVVEDLITQGIVQETDGQWSLQGELQTVAGGVPDSLRQLIERQLERLPEDAQQLLAVASVVGMEFSAAAIVAGLQVEVEAIEAQCDGLVRKGQFLRAEGTEEWPDGTLSERYSFRHALYRDVLYERLAETRRVRLHRRIGERREAAYGERAGEIAAELAMHFEAGRETHKAVYYCRIAGDIALRRYAHREAVQYLNKGLMFLSALPESPERERQELAMQVTLGDSLITTQGYAAPETEQAYRRAWELCQRIGDTPRLFPTLAGLRSFYAMRGEQRTAYEFEEQLFTLARQAQDSAWLMWARLNRGTTLLWLGAFVEARTHLEQGVALSDPGYPRSDLPLYGNPAVMGWSSHTATVLWALGYPDQALQKIQQARALADELADSYSIAYAQATAAMIHVHRREGRAAQDSAEAVIALCTAQGIPFWLAGGTMFKGVALVEQGHAQDGISQIELGLQLWRATGAANIEPYWLAFLAEGYGKAGQLTSALTLVAEALARMEYTEERWWEAELYRLKGQLLLNAERGMRNAESSPQFLTLNTEHSTLNTQVEAEACFQKALAVARSQKAKSLELRAAMNLSRLWQQQDKITEARELLEDIYGWFTEGFDTKDLQEAKALLVALGGHVEREPQPPAAAPSVPLPVPFSASSPSSHANTRPLLQVPSECERTTALATEERIARAQISTLAGNTDTPPPDSGQVFRHEGEYWTVGFAGTVRRIRDIRGLHYLAYLLARPHDEVHVLTLAADGSTPWENESTREIARQRAADLGISPDAALTGFTDAGEVLDPQAKAAYRQRLRDLQAELDEAQAYHDAGRIEKLQGELEFLTRELSQAVGLGGRTRKAASAAERARINVTKALKVAIRKIREQHPALGQHLTQAIRTGTFCVYEPRPRQSSSWKS